MKGVVLENRVVLLGDLLSEMLRHLEATKD